MAKVKPMVYGEYIHMIFNTKKCKVMRLDYNNKKVEYMDDQALSTTVLEVVHKKLGMQCLNCKTKKWCNGHSVGLGVGGLHLCSHY